MMPARTKIILSPKTGRLTTYFEHSVIMSCQPAAPVAPESLRTLMNSELTAQGYDASVDEVKIIQEWADTNVISHMWIAEQSPIGPFTALAILALVVGVVATVYIIASSAQTIIEHFWPQSKFYQIDAAGNPIVVGSLAEYITCQRATHPEGFVCGWCGQVFPTPELRDDHQETCPWKDGVPNGNGGTGLIVLALGTVVVIAGLWAIAKIFG